MTATASPHRIPLGIKIAYTAFMAVLIPVYLKNYGPTNFLYFCDVAAILTVIAIWLENALILSAALVGIFIPQMLWVIDFFCEIFGGRLTGMTSYMFKPPYFLRFLSFFHFWLPFLLVYLVWRVGYDKRAPVLWSGIAWVVLTVCYAYMPPASSSVEPPASEPPMTHEHIGEIRGKILEGSQRNRLLILVDENGKEVARTRTQPAGAHGAYEFVSIQPGRYRVQLRDPNIPVNIDYVYSITSDEEPQKWMDADLYFALYLAFLVVVIFLPTHFLFAWLMPAAK